MASDRGSAEHEPRVLAALEELKHAIRERYPDAVFAVFRRDGPEGVRPRATVDVEDTKAALDTVIDLPYEYRLEQRLPIYVTPAPPVRVHQQLKARTPRRIGLGTAALLSAVTRLSPGG